MPCVIMRFLALAFACLVHLGNARGLSAATMLNQPELDITKRTSIDALEAMQRLLLARTPSIATQRASPAARSVQMAQRKQTDFETRAEQEFNWQDSYQTIEQQGFGKGGKDLAESGIYGFYGAMAFILFSYLLVRFNVGNPYENINI
mmetsp:Transcript_39667/g.63020  ORF Transcript_39667/g.63020 Transcript_39667/m.63020 type:complete len:148 (+) Transcript_39667:67-510(+)